MLAARLHAARDVRIETVADPVAGPGEVLVRVRAVAICPSDWRLWDSGDAGGAPLAAPIIQGHEFAGEVASLGEGVTDLRVGARVAVEPSWHCGHCDMCARGLFNVCRNVRFPSFPPHNGALAELIACPRHAVYELPASMSYEEGAMVEPLGVAIHAVRLSLGAGRACPAVIVFGAGVIGLCTVQLARLRGAASITVVEPIAARREMALRYGATAALGSQAELADADVEAELVFECSGYSGAVAEALHAVTPAGRLMVVGIPHPETVTFEANVPRRHELTITFTRRSRDTLAEAVELAASGEVDLRSMPVRRFRLAEADAAIAATGERPGDMLRAIVMLG